MVTTPVALIEQYLAHRHQREAQILAALTAAAPAALTAADLVARVYPALPSPGVAAAAGNNVLQHLDKLRDEGRVSLVGTAPAVALSAGAPPPADASGWHAEGEQVHSTAATTAALVAGQTWAARL